MPPSALVWTSSMEQVEVLCSSGVRNTQPARLAMARATKTQVMMVSYNNIQGFERSQVFPGTLPVRRANFARC